MVKKKGGGKETTMINFRNFLAGTKHFQNGIKMYLLTRCLEVNENFSALCCDFWVWMLFSSQGLDTMASSSMESVFGGHFVFSGFEGKMSPLCSLRNLMVHYFWHIEAWTNGSHFANVSKCISVKKNVWIKKWFIGVCLMSTVKSPI